MARETKVGLLAGLAFIVCFAVILANRGQLDSRAREHTFLAKTDKPADSRTRNTRNLGRQNDSRTNSSHQASRNNPTTRQPQRLPTRVDIPPPAQHQSRTAGPTDGQEQLPEQIQSQDPRRNSMNPNGPPRQDAAGFGSLTSQTSPDAYDSTNSQAEQAQLRVTNGDSANRSPHNRSVDGLIRYAAGAIVPVTQPSTNRARARATYQVKAGDTLYKIAARQLGESSRRNVDAIFDANRSIMSSPDQIKVGMEIVIPTMSTQVASPDTRSRQTSRTQPGLATELNSRRSMPVRQAPRFRWYQIKKNDRYINIARNELGDSKRWHEIHDLNKMNFPNPDKIRAGVRIKLPLASAVASAESGR